MADGCLGFLDLVDVLPRGRNADEGCVLPFLFMAIICVPIGLIAEATKPPPPPPKAPIVERVKEVPKRMWNRWKIERAEKKYKERMKQND